jgi:predicted transcriptional regulator
MTRQEITQVRSRVAQQLRANGMKCQEGAKVLNCSAVYFWQLSQKRKKRKFN